MATIKSHTDLSQSKKLAEILPIESADMCWFEGEPFVEAVTGYEEERAESHRQVGMEMYPCWSLASLLGVLPTLDGRNAVLCKDIRYDEWHICYHSTATLSVIDTERYDNPVDACYEMILKLHKLKKL